MFEITYKQIIDGVNKNLKTDKFKEKAEESQKCQNDSVYEPKEISSPSAIYEIKRPKIFNVFFSVY